MSQERKSFGERFAEFSQKLDILQIAIGGVVWIFVPEVGFLIITGSAVTYGLAEQYKQGQKRKQLLRVA